MLKPVGLFVLFLFYAVLTTAQTVLHGRVLDAAGQPIAGATVVLLNSQRNVVTDSTGRFSIDRLTGGSIQLHVSAIGFASLDQEADLHKITGEHLIRLQDAATHLGAVVVTAQKKEEDPQHIPVSVTPLSSRQVRDYRLWAADELTAVVPNLYSANPGDQRNVVSVRGITSTSYDPAVTTYIDGVSQFSLDTYIAQLFDIDRIEVLRGPQGSLYGRNAMGGVINIITRQPGNDLNGFAELSLGNHGQQRYSAGISAPLVKDKLYFAAAGLYEGSNGFYKNVFNQSDYDKQHQFLGNAYLKWLMSSRWTLVANFKTQVNRNQGPFALAPDKASAFAQPFEVNQNATTKMIDNTVNASLSFQYAGAHFNMSSQTAFQSNYRYYTDPIDGDFSPIDGITIINNYGKPWNKVNVLTQEFRFGSPATIRGPLRWTAGIYLFYQDNPTKQATHFGEDAALVGSPDSNYAIINTSKGKRWGGALFGQLTYHFAPHWWLVGGLRADQETDRLEVLGQYQPDGASSPAFDIVPDTSAQTSFTAISPTLSLRYEWKENHTVYASYNRGYRAGGLTPIGADPSQPPLYPYKPEYSNNIELGSKNSFARDRLRINVALFYTTITDAQTPTLILPQAITIIRNSGRLTSKGAELELAATPLRGLEFQYQFGYTDARYDELSQAQNGSTVDLKGKRQVFTPQYTSQLAVQFSRPFPAGSRLSYLIRGEWAAIGDQYFDLANSIEQKAYSLFNVRAGVSGKRWGIYGWGRNLSDKKYIAYAYDFGAVHLGNPLTYGATLSLRLGSPSRPE